MPAWARCLVVPIVASFGLMLADSAAQASVDVRIDLGSQRMTVAVDGAVRHVWPVSTARRGKYTPTGSFRPQAMKVWHRSTLYNGAPMPHSIFFTGNYAIHGTTEVGRLGRPASAGCVRLHPANAAALFALVRQQGRGSTRIVITR